MNSPHDPSRISQLLRNLERQICPVVIEGPDPVYRFGGIGTAFIIKHRNYYYVVSARHIWRSLNITTENFRIILRDTKYSLRFDYEAEFKTDYDFEDMVILRIYPNDYGINELDGMRWVDTKDFILDDSNNDEAKYVIIGYSEDDISYDYEKRILDAKISLTVCEHQQSIMAPLHTIKACELARKNYRGLSGSPVIKICNNVWKIAGMAIMGTEASGLFHYIPASAIHYTLEDFEARLNADKISDSKLTPPK